MTPDGSIKLVADLLDLPLIDSEGKYCGIVDDLEFSGSAGKPPKLTRLLVGPGAYSGRLPVWAMWLVARIAGNRICRVPIDTVQTIGSAVRLKCPGTELGLRHDETRIGQWIPRKGAL